MGFRNKLFCRKLSEDDKKELREIFERMVEGDSFAVVAFMFMSAEQKEYVLALLEEYNKKIRRQNE